jgi:hypothetical protein
MVGCWNIAKHLINSCGSCDLIILLQHVGDHEPNGCIQGQSFSTVDDILKLRYEDGHIVGLNECCDTSPTRRAGQITVLVEQVSSLVAKAIKFMAAGRRRTSPLSFRYGLGVLLSVL